MTFEYGSRISSDGALSITLNDSWAGKRLMEALNQLPQTRYGSLTDMRFQQKQQLEREQRKLEMTGPKINLDSSIDGKSLNSSFGTGKVRQMFDERRQRGTGIDKSYPLKPIAPRSSPAVTTTTKSMTSSSVRKQASTMSQVNGRVRSVDSETRESLSITRRTDDLLNSRLNGNGSILNKNYILGHDSPDIDQFSDDRENDNDILAATYSSKLPNVGKLASLSLEDNKNSTVISGDRNNNNGNRMPVNNNIKLKPLSTKTNDSGSKTNLRSDSIRNKSSTVGRSSTPDKIKPETKSSAKSPANSGASKKVPSSQRVGSPVKPTPAVVPDNMAACRICGRVFNNDRIEKHEQVCEKTATKKRKVFDVTKHRVKGTEAEQYIKKASKPQNSRAASSKTTDAAAAKKSDWRRKHEEFIQAIRAAKTVQAHLAKGGKLSDLPPPPPSENPDYIQCPHCSRKFNQAAATRHIPKCANMLHNKPKPGAASKKKR